MKIIVNMCSRDKFASILKYQCSNTFTLGFMSPSSFSSVKVNEFDEVSRVLS